MKTRKIFNYNIFNINKKELLLANKYKPDVKFYKMRND